MTIGLCLLVCFILSLTTLTEAFDQIPSVVSALPFKWTLAATNNNTTPSSGASDGGGGNNATVIPTYSEWSDTCYIACGNSQNGIQTRVCVTGCDDIDILMLTRSCSNDTIPSKCVTPSNLFIGLIIGMCICSALFVLACAYCIICPYLKRYRRRHGHGAAIAPAADNHMALSATMPVPVSISPPSPSSSKLNNHNITENNPVIANNIIASTAATTVVNGPAIPTAAPTPTAITVTPVTTVSPHSTVHYVDVPTIVQPMSST
jgi:hypothetical protein